MQIEIASKLLLYLAITGAMSMICAMFGHGRSVIVRVANVSDSEMPEDKLARLLMNSWRPRLGATKLRRLLR